MEELLRQLIAQRQSVWAQAKTVLDTAAARPEAERALTAEENQEFERMNTELDDLGERIQQTVERLEREAAADEMRARAEQFIRPELSREQTDAEGFDERFVAWARGAGGKAFEVDVTGIRTERNEHGAWQVRDILKGSGTGAQTVPTTFRRQLYEHMIENSGIRQTRVEVITTASGEALVLPKTTAHPTQGTVLPEATAIQEGDPVFGQGTLLAYKVPRMVEVSTEMLQDTGVDLLGYLAKHFGKAIANGAGVLHVIGTGSSQPTGVITAAGTIVQITGGTGVAGAPTADNLIDLFYGVNEAYAEQGEWLMRRRTVGTIRKFKDSQGQYLWQPAIAAGQPETILGAPVRMDPNVPAVATGATSIAFGDFSAHKIRDVGGVRFERSDHFSFDDDMVTFRAILRTDSDLLDRTGAIGTFKGAAT